MARKKKKPIDSQKAALMSQASSYKDIQRRAIVLGMSFPDVVNSDIQGLLSFIHRSDAVPNPSLIDEYDDWMDKHLESIGYDANDPIRSSKLRLGYLGEEKEGGKRKIKRVPGIKKPKEKKPAKERDEFNLWKGTKKSYTFELAQRGYDLERVTRRVKKKFPEANEKSIRLWFGAARRAIKKKADDKA